MNLNRFQGESSEDYAARIAAGTRKLRESNGRMAALVEGVRRTTAFKDAVVKNMVEPESRGAGL